MPAAQIFRFRLLLAIALVISLTTLAQADTLSYKMGGAKGVKKDVIITFQSPQRIEYLTTEKGGFVEKEVIYDPEDLKTTLSSEEEKKGILENWKQRTSSAFVARDFGPTFSIAAFGVRYPLPRAKSRSLTVRPKLIEGAEFYVGKDSANASKVFFKEVQSTEILKNGTFVRVLWKNSETSEGDLLPSWKYGQHMGDPAVLFGMNMETLSYVELPLKSIRKITLAAHKTISCSGSPSHSFGNPPGSWKYCPICGKPFVGKE